MRVFFEEKTGRYYIVKSFERGLLNLKPQVGDGSVVMVKDKKECLEKAGFREVRLSEQHKD